MARQICGFCDGNGVDPNCGDEYEPCPECMHGETFRCELCDAKEFRYVAIESTEPHGERFLDQGWKCTNCGAVETETEVESLDLLGKLRRSIALATKLKKQEAA